MLCTAAAYILYFAILARAGATNLLLVTFLLPASALLLGALVLAEPVTPRALAGMALILGVDRFMSEARSLTNFIGNGVATIVVAGWEGELDRAVLNRELSQESKS